MTCTKTPAVATPTASAIDEFRQKLEEYTAAHQKYEDDIKAYWSSIADKRRTRNTKRRNGQEILIDDYVLSQPRVYSGSSKPVDPLGPIEEVPPPKKYGPIVADFL